MRFSQQNIKVAVAAFITIAPGFGAAAPFCESVKHANSTFTVCSFVPAADIRLFLKSPEGNVYGAFAPVAERLDAQGESLVFAMNAGMYHPDFSPVGLYVEKGVMAKGINRQAGAGNFGMKPNGVFWVKDGKAGVMETGKFVNAGMKPDYASQSGPMLVIDGKIHPKIHADGTSEKTRNGVGQCDDGLLRFAISENAVTFYAFASLFSERLKCPQALYFDGSISSLYAPELKRNDSWKPMGPIVGVVVGAAKKEAK